MYTIEQVEKINAVIHNTANDTKASELRMKVVSDIYLFMITHEVTTIPKEALTDEEAKLFEHYLTS